MWRIAALVAYALSIVAFAAVAPVLSPVWDTPDFRRVLLVVFASGAFVALVFAASRMRTRFWGRALGLVVVSALVAGALYFAPNTPIGTMARLREQTHVVQYGFLAVASAFALKRRTSDLSLYAMAMGVVLATGLVDEWVQWWVPGRVGALEDIRLDLASGLVGTAFAALVLLLGEVQPRLGPPGGARALRTLAVVALGLTAFIHRVHLGHAIPLPEVGVVVASRYTRAGLERQGGSWSPRPQMTVLGGILAGKDFYAGEARYHRDTRDRRLVEGDAIRAAQEDAVLASLYGPYLAAHPDALLTPEQRAVLVTGAALREAPVETGPELLTTAIDALTLWLAGIAVTSAALLAAELLLLRRGQPAASVEVLEPEDGAEVRTAFPPEPSPDRGSRPAAR